MCMNAKVAPLSTLLREYSRPTKHRRSSAQDPSATASREVQGPKLLPFSHHTTYTHIQADRKQNQTVSPR